MYDKLCESVCVCVCVLVYVQLYVHLHVCIIALLIHGILVVSPLLMTMRTMALMGWLHGTLVLDIRAFGSKPKGDVCAKKGLVDSC